MKSEIIAVGSEMLTPARQNTNSLYLTEKLNEIGVTVAFKTVVGDRRKDLVGAIRTALEIGEVSPDVLTLYEGEKIDVTYTDPCRADGSRDVPVRLSIPTASALSGLAAK